MVGMLPGTLIIKSDCPKCGKKKALKTVVTLLNGDAHLSGCKCHKCGYTLSAAGPSAAVKTNWPPKSDL